MDQKALKLCAAFSRQPNSLGYCGRESAKSAFKTCLIEHKCEEVPNEVEQFIVLNPYLDTISQATNQPKYSKKVIEAFWLGNDLLNSIKLEHYKLLLDNLKKQGVPDFLIYQAAQNPPKRFIPIHLFNIIHIGVGKASGSVPFNLDSINQCMIRWGRIKHIRQDKALIKLNSLDSTYQLIQKETEIAIEPNITPNLKTGDVVTAHWGTIAKKINSRELSNLKYWTAQFIAAL